MAAWNSFLVHSATWIWSIVGTKLCRGQGPSGLVPTHFKCLWSWRAHHLWPLQHQLQLKIEKIVWIVQVCTLSKLTFVLVRRPKSYICWCLDGHYLNAHMNRYWNTCKYTKLKLLSLRAFWCFGEESPCSLPRIDINYYYLWNMKSYHLLLREGKLFPKGPKCYWPLRNEWVSVFRVANPNTGYN